MQQLPTSNIFKIRSQSFPEFLFEYHTDTKTCWVIPIGKTVFKEGESYHQADKLAEDIQDIMTFKYIVAAWLAGYKVGYEQPSKLVIK